MKKLILACLFIVVVLPSMTSSLRVDQASPISVLALAGHSQIGSLVACDCPNDPVDGICPCCGAVVTESIKTDDGNDSLVQGVSSDSTSPKSDSDFGSGTLLDLLALIVWSIL